MLKRSLLAACCFAFTLVSAQSKQINYMESAESPVNPERGFYIPMGTKASHFVSLDPEKLRLFREQPQKSHAARYAVRISLLYRAYELDSFKDQPLSQQFLEDIQKDFDAVRMAGLKIILRFAYTNTANKGNCKDEYEICPPYGDAPREIVMNHIRQLAPLLKRNADVIAVLQEGFIGIWGENYFTDYFGDASNAGTGKILDSSWRHRNELLKALLDAMPESRMVQVRTPQIKQKFVYGPSAVVTSSAITEAIGFDGSDAARIGFHNDCFLSSVDDYGTYQDYGSSSQPRQPANDVLRRYIQADTRYTAVGGETCDDAYSPQNDCAPFGHAEEEMAAMHYSYLNASYNVQVNNDWDSLGCMHSIERRLGYRLILRKATLPVQVKKNGTALVDFEIENTGYASMFNPRPVRIIFRNKLTGKESTSTLSVNPQRWFTGVHHVKENIRVPAGITAGEYDLFLSLPDANVVLSKRPEYSVQLCNDDMWESRTGYNSLHHTIRVK